MRSVVVVFPASICAAIPMLRVRSIEYCRSAELCGFALAPLSFSITASIEMSVLRIKTPRETFGHRGALLLFTITSGNVQMLCSLAPSYGPHHACEWRSPAPDRLPKFRRQAPLSLGCPCGRQQNRLAIEERAKTGDQWAPQ